MLSLLNKSGGKAAVVQPSWHPNFRNVEHLPDTKAVRTAFFVNGLAVFCAVVLTTWFAYREYGLRILSDNVAAWEQTNSSNGPSSDAAVASYKKFQAQEKNLKLADQLLTSPVVFSDLIFHLGETLPPSVAFRSIDYRGGGVNLSGFVKGAPEEASGLVTAYLDQLRKDEYLQKIFGQIELTNMSRNASEGVSMELVLKFPAPAKK